MSGTAVIYIFGSCIIYIINMNNFVALINSHCDICSIIQAPSCFEELTVATEKFLKTHRNDFMLNAWNEHAQSFVLINDDDSYDIGLKMAM